MKPAGARVRVLVAEDSLTMRKRLIEVLAEDARIEVVGEARDGQEAIDLCRSLHPDVITMDMMMPRMTGLSATEQIMAFCPTPILIVSSSFNRGEVFRTFDALKAGAVEVIEKPAGDETDGAWEARLRDEVALVSRIRVISHPRARLAPLLDAVARPRVAPAPVWEGKSEPRLVAIGASTGGPVALAAILRALPGDFPLPIAAVVHIGAPFAPPLVEWLSTQTALPVSLARSGGLPERGVTVCPGGFHLELRGGRYVLGDGPERHSCKPSVDVLFESVARELGSRAIACLLTGMGRDGADGLLALRRAGAETIAQDEASSVVFGMPKEAVRLGAARHVAALDAIPSLLVALCRPAAQGAPP